MKRARTLGELGEDAAIERIARAARRSGPPGSRVLLGIGDDAALLRPAPGEALAVSTDARIEDVHFRWQSESARHVGRVALVASLSDLAAMGARPLGCVLALAAPPGLAVRDLDGLLAGILHEARAHACPLVGGNVSRARETSLTLTVLGGVARGRALTRRGARPNDRICVTGCLGARALQVARAARGRGRVVGVPEPRLAAGRALARVPGIGGVIDVSDGLELDLERLLAPSGLAAAIDPSRVPLPRGFAARCRREGLDALELALGGGEDYELCFTLRPRGPSPAALSARLGVPVAEIGRAVRRDRRRGAAPRGWQHLSGSA